MRILVFGCDDFAALNLKRLIDDGHKVVGLVTQPDKPRGRGLHVVFSPTKEIALSKGIEVFQPETLKDAAVIETIRPISSASRTSASVSGWSSAGLTGMRLLGNWTFPVLSRPPMKPIASRP